MKRKNIQLIILSLIVLLSVNSFSHAENHANMEINETITEDLQENYEDTNLEEDTEDILETENIKEEIVEEKNLEDEIIEDEIKDSKETIKSIVDEPNSEENFNETKSSKEAKKTIVLKKGKSYQIQNTSDEDLSKLIKLGHGKIDYVCIDKYGDLEYKSSSYKTNLSLDGKTSYIITVYDDKDFIMPYHKYEEHFGSDILVEESSKPALYIETLEKDKSYQIQNTSDENLSKFIKLGHGKIDYRYIDKYGDLEYKSSSYKTDLSLDGKTSYVITVYDDKDFIMPYHKYEEHFDSNILVEESSKPALYIETLEKNKSYQIQNTSDEDLSKFITLGHGKIDYRYIDKYGDLEYKSSSYKTDLSLNGKTSYIITVYENKDFIMPYHKYEEHFDSDILVEESSKPALYLDILEKYKSYRILNTSDKNLSKFIKLGHGKIDYSSLNKYGDLEYKNSSYKTDLNLDGKTNYIITIYENKDFIMPYHKYEEHFDSDILVEESETEAFYKKDLVWNKPLEIKNISRGNNLTVNFKNIGNFTVELIDSNGNITETNKNKIDKLIIPANTTVLLTHTSKQDNYVYTPYRNVEEFLIFDKEKELVSEYKSHPGKNINDEKKTWTIEFNKTIDAFTANKRNIYIIDSQGNKYNNIKVQSSGNKVFLENTGRFNKNEKYEVVIEKEVKSLDNKSLTKGVTMTFQLDI